MSNSTLYPVGRIGPVIKHCLSACVAVILGLILVWLPSCSSPRPPLPNKQERRHAPEVNIREVVLRFQFKSDITGIVPMSFDYVFVGMGSPGGPQREPENELIRRLNDLSPPVLPVSQALAATGGGVRHKKLGGRGIIVCISEIEWVEDGIAEVKGGYYLGGLSAAEHQYRVEWNGTSWTVVSDTELWVS